MNDSAEQEKDRAVLLRLTPSAYEGLQEDARRISESEQRRVTVTEVVRRRVLGISLSAVA